jgi:hypothetical protein
MVSVIMVSVIMLNVIMLSVIMLSVIALWLTLPELGTSPSPQLNKAQHSA